MFYFSIFTVLFLVLFFLPIYSWTKWSVLGTIILLITSHLYVQTDAIKWNVAFVYIFGLAVFLFTCFGKKCLQNLILIAALAMFSSGLEWFLSVHHEFLRMDLWLLRGLCFLFFLWIFKQRDLFAICLAIAALFLHAFFLAFVQLHMGHTAEIGNLQLLNECGFLLLGFIFFSICERIQMVEKNYG